MIVFNLACDQQHVFEGWFSSAKDFDSQLERGLIECPACASKRVEKRLSAPRLNFGAKAEPVATSGSNPSTLANVPSVQAKGQDMVMAKPSPEAAMMLEKMQTMWMEMAKQIVANTEDVGSGFAEEARRIHYKEVPERAIRGQASAQEAEALAEEGIEIASFPLPSALKRPLQ